MEHVKFRKGVAEEVRQEVREIMCGKVFYEAYTGMAASLAPMFTYLAEKGYHAVFHVDLSNVITIVVQFLAFTSFMLLAILS